MKRATFDRSSARLTLVALATLAAAAATAGACADRSGAREMGAREMKDTSAVPAVAPIRFAGRDPGLAPAADGGLHVAYVIDGDGGARVVYRRLAPDGAAGEPVLVSPPEVEVSAHGEVPPRIVSLGAGEDTGASLAIAYTVRLPGQWQGEILLQRSRDQGGSWSSPERLHDDAGAGGSHAFLDAIALADGAAVFAWLDNRDGAQGLRTARLGSDGVVAPNQSVDPLTCQCCATALLADGADVFVAYRDLEGSVRDISMARSSDGGRTFALLGQVSADGWQIDGCPHTGPRLAQDRGGALWATWFSGAKPGIYAARLPVGGSSFAPRQPVAVPDAARPGPTFVAHPEIGRLPDGRLVVLYESTRGDAAGLEMRTIAADAGLGPARRLVEEGAFPRLAASGGRTWLSYTAAGADSEVVIVDLEALPLKAV